MKASMALPPSRNTWSAASVTMGSCVLTITLSPTASFFGPWLSSGSLGSVGRLARALFCALVSGAMLPATTNAMSAKVKNLK